MIKSRQNLSGDPKRAAIDLLKRHLPKQVSTEANLWSLMEWNDCRLLDQDLRPVRRLHPRSLLERR